MCVGGSHAFTTRGLIAKKGIMPERARDKTAAQGKPLWPPGRRTSSHCDQNFDEFRMKVHAAPRSDTLPLLRYMIERTMLSVGGGAPVASFRRPGPQPGRLIPS